MLKTRLILATALLCACASRPGPPETPLAPHQAAEQVVNALLEAADPAAEDAVETWRSAHATFEEQLEPLLRDRFGDREVAQIEYEFGLLRSRLGTGQAAESARILGEHVAAMCADLPNPSTS